MKLTALAQQYIQDYRSTGTVPGAQRSPGAERHTTEDQALAVQDFLEIRRLDNGPEDRNPLPGLVDFTEQTPIRTTVVQARYSGTPQCGSLERTDHTELEGKPFSEGESVYYFSPASITGVSAVVHDSRLQITEFRHDRRDRLESRVRLLHV